ncbi:MAG: CPBP family intramembrane metalloprotease [Candidatus Omnitrophica bacterium]|nr:CPBP family intramembrane metalloprotease [Candidatus Omnitrophota bacterium]
MAADDASLSEFNVPWRVRDALKAILFPCLILWGLIAAIAVGFGLAAAIGHGDLDEAVFRRWFADSPAGDLWYLVQGLLMVLWLYRGILRPCGVRLRSFFAPSRPVGASAQTGGAALTSDVRRASRLFLVAMSLSVAVLGISIAAVLLASRWTHQEPNAALSRYFEGRIRESERLLQPEMTWLRALIVVVIGPLIEEVMFRGCLYAALRKRHRPWAANLMSSGLFALLHCYYFHLPSVLVIGMVAAYAYERTRSLRTPLAFHLLWNLFGVGSVKPEWWLVPALAGLVLWMRRPAPSSGGRIGWKIYAVALPFVILVAYAADRAVAWQAVFDVPVVVAVGLYGWKRAWGPRGFWKVYAVWYVLWLALTLWATMVPAAMRSGWQHVLAASHPLAGWPEVAAVLLSTVVLIGPALVVLWRTGWGPAVWGVTRGPGASA